MSSLSQGTFVGMVADDKKQIIKLKSFHADVIVDEEVVDKEDRTDRDVPAFRQKEFMDTKGNDIKEQVAEGKLRTSSSGH